MADVGQSRIDSHVGAVALRRTGHVDDGFGQDDAPFRPADELDGLGSGIGDDQSLGIGQSYVFSRTDDQAAGDEGRLFSGVGLISR